MSNSQCTDLRLRELKRFFTIAKLHQEESQVLMPACPVDEAWHELIKEDNRYREFCREAVGSQVQHLPVDGEGEIGWVEAYEDLFGTLSPIWFCDSEGNFNESAWKRYSETGEFHASWDCEPYIVEQGVEQD